MKRHILISVDIYRRVTLVFTCMAMVVALLGISVAPALADTKKTCTEAEHDTTQY